MKKKKGIRYSELSEAPNAPPPAPVIIVAPAVVEAPAPGPPVRDTPPVISVPRPRRDSTPVELARALAAAVSAESAARTTVAGAAADAFREPAAAGRPASPVSTKVATVELLMFRVGLERFAVELLSVDEVIDLPVVHHVPEMPPAMLGVVTVRGSLTPVYSPHVALGVALALREAVLIFRRGRARVGILIDDVDDAISIDIRELRTMQESPDGGGVVLGVMRHAGVLVAIVDAAALIAACQAAALLETA